MDKITVMGFLEGLTDPDWSHFHSDSEVQNIASEALSLLKEDCHNCKLECLLQKYDELKEKYDVLLKEQEAREQCLKTKCIICPHCDNCDVDENGLLKEQEAKTGHWTISEYEYLDCSCCGNSYYTGCDSTEEAKMRLKKGFCFNYCPYCGAKMGNEVEGR